MEKSVDYENIKSKSICLFYTKKKKEWVEGAESNRLGVMKSFI